MIKSGFDLLCVGNALVDVFVRDTEDLHIRYGITDPVQHVEIELIEKILGHFAKFTAVSGGGAANIAKIASLLERKTCFIGSIGDDKFGQLFEENLTAAGVKLIIHKRQTPTGICLVLRTKDATRIAASPSASLELFENDIDSEDIKRAKVIVFDGFMLGRQKLKSHILDLARLYKKPVAIDLSSPYIAAEMAKEIEAYCEEHKLILFMNENEAEVFYNSLNATKDETTKRKTFIAFFKSLTKGKAWPLIAVKQGSRGALCFAGGEAYRSKTTAITPVDTTSAGDAFGAGFLSAWLKGKDLASCVAFGNETAALVLGAEGSQINNLALKLAR